MFAFFSTSPARDARHLTAEEVTAAYVEATRWSCYLPTVPTVCLEAREDGAVVVYPDADPASGTDLVVYAFRRDGRHTREINGCAAPLVF